MYISEQGAKSESSRKLCWKSDQGSSGHYKQSPIGETRTITMGSGGNSHGNGPRSIIEGHATTTKQAGQRQETRLIDAVLRLARERKATARAEAKGRARAEEQRHWTEVRAPAHLRLISGELEAQLANVATARRQQRHHDEAAARQRERRRGRNRLSRAEVDERVWAAVDDEAARTRQLGGSGALGRGAGEAVGAWGARVRRLEARVRRLWIDNEERIVGAEPRYVEGLPAREALRPPVFLPPTWPRVPPASPGTPFRLPSDGHDDKPWTRAAAAAAAAGGADARRRGVRPARDREARGVELGDGRRVEADGFALPIWWERR